MLNPVTLAGLVPGKLGLIRLIRCMTENKEIERLKNEIFLINQLAEKNKRKLELLQNRSLLERIFNFDPK